MPVLEAVQTFAGITNENEFYSHHYLAEVFKGDIKDRLEAWDAQEAQHPSDAPDHEQHRAPPKRLQAWAQRWFALRGQVQRGKDEHERWQAFMQIQAGLLQALGYAPPPRTLTLHELAPGLPSQLLENRPDIVAAERQLQAANARVGAARAMFFPRIALTTMAGTASADLDGLFASGSRAWTFAPSVSLPIFDGGRRQANLELAQVQREQALNEYQQAIESAFRDVADALAAGQSLQEQLQTLRATEDTLTERARLAGRRYEAGAARYFEVLDAERDLLATQQQVVQAEHALLTARLRLYAALGGGSRTLAPLPLPLQKSEE